MGADNVEDIYGLSPLQRGMLLHSTYDGAADMHLSQQTYLAAAVAPATAEPTIEPATEPAAQPEQSIAEMYRHILAAEAAATQAAPPEAGQPAADLDTEIDRLEQLVARTRAGRQGSHAGADLVPVPREGSLVCTFQQEGMWFMNQFAPSWSSYHVPFALRLHGPLDVPALERALHALVVRHEALRTRFVAVDGVPRQVIDPPPASTSLGLVDLPADRVLAWASAICQQPFDLAGGPGFRAAAARVGPDEHVVVMIFHHIVTDGWSGQVLGGELSALYTAECAGTPVTLPPVALQPADYAAWQRRHLRGAERDRQVGRWREVLAGLSTVDFPTDRPRPAQPTGAGGNVTVRFPSEVADAMRGYCQENRVSMLALLHAGLVTVLHRYTGQRDLPVGSILAGRTRRDLEQMVGYFGNVVVLRGDLRGSPTFAELVRRSHATVIDATSRQDVPFPLVVDAVRPDRAAGRNPLFQIGLTYHPPGLNAALRLGDVTGEMFELEEEYALWDIAFDIVATPDGTLLVSIDYSTELFDADRMRRLAADFGRALRAGLAAPATPADEVEILPAEERDRLLRAGSGDTAAADDVGLVHRAVEAVAAGRPDAVAVVDHDGATVTYRQLDETADRLAHRLRGAGVGPGVPVGVCLPRGRAQVTALLAVWKAGGWQVPVDPDAGDAPPVVVTHRVRAAAFTHAVAIDDDGEEASPGPDGGATPDDLAGVLRTGAGAAVLVGHRAVHEQIARLRAAFPTAPDERVLHATPYGFPGSVAELFWPLTTGATVVLAAPDRGTDPAYLRDLVAAHRVTTVRTVPTTLRGFLDGAAAGPAPTALRRVLCSGEALPADTARRFHAAHPGVALHDVRGGAMAGDVAAGPVEPGAGAGPLGRPLPGVRAYVLDDRLRPVPDGVPGQLFVAGPGLAHGYLGRPAATARRLVADPHADRPGQRMYATGDLVRRRTDGRLEHVGPMDRRVTVRGQRIDPGLVEDALAGHPGVRECAVVAHGADLVAYVAGNGDPPERAAIRRFLSARLPAYLVPTRLVVLPALPRTPDGRRDLTALPEPTPPGAEPAPRTDTERRLAAIWADLLGVDRVGAGDSFFDAGGNSLDATRLVARIGAHLGVDLHLRHVFSNPTLEDLAARIEEERDDDRQLSDRAIR